MLLPLLLSTLIDSTEVRTVGLSVDAIAFFTDNEFDGNMVKGYSLPGFRIQPRVTYTPLQQIRLEAGLHATVYDGAGKYPAYVFHDIATWKGDQYTPGAHYLPFFRAVAELPRLTVVLGDIFGGMEHGIALPLWNPELTFSDDPEMGAQFIVNRPRWHSDTWINWTSYIYEESTHQESFTVGWTQRINLWQPRHRHATAPATVTPPSPPFQRRLPLQSERAGGEAVPATVPGVSTPAPSPVGRGGLSLPLQLLVTHRGGEQDATQLGVQTLCNAAAGLRYDAYPRRGAMTHIAAEALALGAYQQSGHLWPFDFGLAAWAGLTADFSLSRRSSSTLPPSPAFQRRLPLQSERAGGEAVGGEPAGGLLTARLGLFRAPDGFCSLYGSPFFGTMSVKYPGVSYTGMTTAYAAVEYAKTFGRHYTLGAKAEAYVSQSRAPFSFGLFFRANPSFVLKRLKP